MGKNIPFEATFCRLGDFTVIVDYYHVTVIIDYYHVTVIIDLQPVSACQQDNRSPTARHNQAAELQ